MRKERKLKQETRKKISEAMRGRKQTVSTRLKISEAMKKYWERIPYEENNNLEFGTIVIRAPAHIASFYLLEFIEEFQAKSPNVFFRIINGSTLEL